MLSIFSILGGPDEAGDQGTGFFAMFSGLVDVETLEIIHRYKKKTSDFRIGSSGHMIELVFFFLSESLESFGKVGHDRNRCPLNLVTESPIPFYRRLPAKSVNFSDLFSGYPPGS